MPSLLSVVNEDEEAPAATGASYSEPLPTSEHAPVYYDDYGQATSYEPIPEVAPEGPSLLSVASEPDYEPITSFGMAPDPAAVQQAYPGPEPEMVDTVKGPLPQGWTPPPPTDAVPEDKFSFFGDFLAQLQAAEGIKDKAGAVLDLQGRGTQDDANRQGQRMLDAARYGDPDRTLGGFGVQDLIAHPENVAYLPGSLVHQFEGGPGGTSAIDTALADPQGTLEAYETSGGDIAAPYRAYQTEMGHTLDTGGPVGAAKGMLVGGLSDPLLPATIATTKGLRGVASLATPAGQEVGLARGVVGQVAKGGALGVEGAYDFTDPALRVAGRALPRVLGRSAQTQSTIAAETVGEAVEGGARTRLSASQQGLAPPSLGGTLPNTAAPGPASAVAPAAPAGTPGSSTLPTAAMPGSPLSGVPHSPTQLPSVPSVTRSPVARSDPRDILLTPLENGRVALSWHDGLPLTLADFDKARPLLASVDPDDFYATQAGLPASWWTRMKSAMTQSGYMYNDWPANRRTQFGNLPENAGKAEAGKRWIDTTAERVQRFGRREVQSLLDDYETDLAGRITVEPGLRSVYFGNRADAIREALRAADFKADVVLGGTQGEMRFTAGATKQAQALRGRPVHPQRVAPSTPLPPAFAPGSDDTMQMIRPIDRQEIVVLESALVPPQQRELFLRLLDDVDGFISRTELNERVANGTVSPGRQAQLEEYIAARKSMYRKRGKTTAWSKSAANPEANRRYNDFVRAWKTRGGASPKLPSQSRNVDQMSLGEGWVQSPENPNIWIDNVSGHRVVRKPNGMWENMSVEMANNWDRALSPDNPIANRELAWLAKDLRDRGFDDVDLYFMDDLLEQNARGLYDPRNKIIEITTLWSEGAPLADRPYSELRRVFEHEFMHAVRDSGVLTEKEWNLLVKTAKSLKHPENKKLSFYGAYAESSTYVQSYGDQFPNALDMLEEEAVADLFSYWMTGRMTGAKEPGAYQSVLRKIYDYIADFVQKVRGTDAEAIFRGLASGETGARPHTWTRTPSESNFITGIENPSYTHPTQQYPNLASPALASKSRGPSLLDEDKYDGLPIAEGFRYIMDQADNHHLMEWDGKPTGIWRVTSNVMDDLDQTRTLAKRLHGTGPQLSEDELKTLGRLEKKYGEVLEGPAHELSDEQLIAATTDYTTARWTDSLPGSSESLRHGLGGEVRGLVRDISSFRRGVGLSNWAAFVRQTMTQYLGNAGTFLITGDVTSARHLVSPTNARRAYQHLQGNARALTDGQDLARAFGLGLNPMVWDDAKSIALHNTDASGVIGRVGNLLAPKALRRIVATPDVMAREAKWRGVFRPAMRSAMKALPADSKALAADFNVGRYAGQLGPVVATVDKVVDDLVRGARKQPGFDGAYLEAGIRKAFDRDIARGTVDRTALNNYANRVARNWNTSVNTANQQAAKAVKDTFFSWDNTKIDDAVSNVFLYHYWSTRAAWLYGKEMAKKPWMTAQFVSLAKQMQAEAEQGDYPEWMKGFTRILNTPAGTALWMSPLDMIATAGQFAEWQYGSLDGQFGADLTLLGKARGLVPFVWNPLVEFGLWMAGAFGGESARVPGNPLGVDRLTTLGASILNLALFHGLLPEGMGTDATGQPVPFSPRPVTDALGALAAHLGRPVASPYGSFESSATAFLYDVVLEQSDGTMSAEDLNTEVNEIYTRAQKGDIDERLVEADRRATELAWEGPEFPGLPEPLRPLVGAAIRHISPIRLLASPMTKFESSHPEAASVLPNGEAYLLGTRAPAETEYGADALKYGLYETPEARDLWAKSGDWYSGGNPELAKLESTYHMIGQGQVSSVTVGSETYDLSQMEENERYDVAETWLDAEGYTEADLDAMDAYRDELEASDPNLAGFMEYDDYLKAFPGGVEGFVSRATTTSPAFARYMEQSGTTPGSPDYYKAATRPGAYLAFAGERSDVYDPQQIPPAGTVPGLGGVDELAIQRATEAPVGDDPEWTGFVEDISDEVANIYGAYTLLNQTYPGSGYTVGDYLDKGTYNAMKPIWEANGIYLPSTKDAKIAYEYFDWLGANATAADHSIEAYLDSRDYPGRGIDPEIPSPQDAAALVGTTLVENTARGRGGVPAAERFGIPARVHSPIELRTGPATGNDINGYVDGTMALEMVYRDDASGWAQVRDENGVIGWVPLSYLLAA